MIDEVVVSIAVSVLLEFFIVKHDAMLQEAVAWIATLPQKDGVAIMAVMKHCYKTMNKLSRDGKHLNELMRRVRNNEVLGELDEGLGLIAKADIVALLADLSQEHKDYVMPFMKTFDKVFDKISQDILRTKGYLSRTMERMAEYRALEKRSRTERGQV